MSYWKLRLSIFLDIASGLIIAQQQWRSSRGLAFRVFRRSSFLQQHFAGLHIKQFTLHLAFEVTLFKPKRSKYGFNA